MNTERLLRLADFLEFRVPAPKFDMRTWLTVGGKPDELYEECGTSACAAGWACALFKDEGLVFEWGPGLEDGQKWYMPAYGELGGSMALEEFFGISYRVSIDLFGTTERTPAQEAALIRKYVSKRENE